LLIEAEVAIKLVFKGNEFVIIEFDFKILSLTIPTQVEVEEEVEGEERREGTLLKQKTTKKQKCNSNTTPIQI
jgi:hypothetical protein